jgi:hypothetical protein
MQGFRRARHVAAAVADGLKDADVPQGQRDRLLRIVRLRSYHTMFRKEMQGFLHNPENPPGLIISF